MSDLGTRGNDDDFDDEFDAGGSPHPPRCSHPSSDGIDRTPADDPTKVWRCHTCDVLHLTDGTRVLDPEIIERWDNFWADIVTCRDGTVDVDQVKCELADYSTCIREVPKVYMEITGGMLSKPNYLASEVIRVHDDQCPNVAALLDDIREVIDETDVAWPEEGISMLREILDNAQPARLRRSAR